MSRSSEIGMRIREFRRKRNFSLENLADRIHKSKATISKYESGEIVLDIETLYDIADALQIPVDALIYRQPDFRFPEEFDGETPAFFRGRTIFYYYYYDGRTNRLVRSVLCINSSVGQNNMSLYMDVENFKNYKLCSYTYQGTIIHYGAMSSMYMQNTGAALDHSQIGIPAPYIDEEMKYVLTFGISNHPLMPMCGKAVICKNPHPETAEFEKMLRISKEDIRLMKLYNHMVLM